VVGITILLGTLGVSVSALWAFTVLPRWLPSVTELETIQPTQGSKLYDENDELITEFQIERRIFVPLAKIPQTLRDAVVAVEDWRFYSHFGVDPMGVARAIYQNFRHGRIVEGGSTITQQLAKVLFLTPDKSLDRKLKEVLLALQLERRYSKDQILEMYLNQVYFGHGAYGVEAAAHTYFGKPVTELSIREAALLAGLPRAPTIYSPFNHPEAARRRRTSVSARRRAEARVGQVTRTTSTRAGMDPDASAPLAAKFHPQVLALLTDDHVPLAGQPAQAHQRQLPRTVDPGNNLGKERVVVPIQIVPDLPCHDADLSDHAQPPYCHHRFCPAPV